MTARERFTRVIPNGILNEDLVGTNLDVADAVASHFSAYIYRYLRGYRSRRVPQKLANCYAELSAEMISYGLFTHFICFLSNKRDKHHLLDQQHLFNEWETRAVGALSILKTYNRENHGVPERLFRELYASDSQPFVNVGKAPFWERIKLEGALRDRFATGLVLGMTIDMETAALPVYLTEQDAFSLDE